ncbi:MAG TPA: DUF5996 family protein [Thermoleophilia bacterium]|nr:DUF5996 family protein [Thermoleophilia bacterium]HUO74027.1 DUF5996 family protein [Solirubrobacteraceae bacterium]
MNGAAQWPALPYAEWAGTKKTLHLCTQMIGKTRLALAPPLPEWQHAGLYLDALGFTTGPMPVASEIVTAGVDVFSPSLWLRKSDGRQASVRLADGRCVADIWHDYLRALETLRVEVDLWDKPQETADNTLFSENTHDCTFLTEQAKRFHGILAAVYRVMEEFRSPFFGRSGVRFWWGAFDLSVVLFNGRRSTPPQDRGYTARYDLDAEFLSAGFWPGDDRSPEPIFAGFVVPRPAGCETVPVEPGPAGWVEAMDEWMMPYEAIRTARDPAQAVRAFFDTVYRAAVTRAGWSADDFTYNAPAPSSRLRAQQR